MLLAETQRGFGGPLAILAAVAVFAVFAWYWTSIRERTPPAGGEPTPRAKTAGKGVSRRGWKFGGGGAEPDYQGELDPAREHLGYTVSYKADGVTRVITPRYADDE